MTKKLHYNIRVSGKVQGVWYRDSTRRKAVELDVAGFVRNEPDGTVYLEAEGSKEALEALKAWCAVGPPNARVDQVEATEAELRHFEGFQITR